jgi:hypothetical protein
MKKLTTLILGLALAGPAILDAAPASWYKWRSRLTGEQVCSQTPLGDGWEQADGPYRDARCQKRGAAK